MLIADDGVLMWVVGLCGFVRIKTRGKKRKRRKGKQRNEKDGS